MFQLQGATGVEEGVPEALGQVAFRAASREAGAEEGGGERLVRPGPLVRGERSGPHQSSRVGDDVGAGRAPYFAGGLELLLDAVADDVRSLAADADATAEVAAAVRRRLRVFVGRVPGVWFKMS